MNPDSILSNFIGPILFVVVVGIVFIVLFFFCLQSNGDSSWNFRNSQLSASRKKIKKKVTNLNIALSTQNEPDEQGCKNKHIEIKNSPDIMTEFNHSNIDPLIHPGKPILRKSDAEILINDEECVDRMWPKIPRDEVELHRSGHSSVVSENNNEFSDAVDRKESKLSRNQKKRYKTKQKTINLKQTDDGLHSNKSAVTDSLNDFDDNTVGSNKNEDCPNTVHTGERKYTHKICKSESLNSSQGKENINSFSSIESEEKFVPDDFVDNIHGNTLENDEDDYIYNNGYKSYTNNVDSSEEIVRLEAENKTLEETVFDLNVKLKDFSTLTSALEKENENHLKRADELERLCNALRKELTLAIQKNESIERRFSRCESESNRQMSIYENELKKLTNKTNILESDLRTKVDDQEAMKNNLEKMHQFMLEKDKHIQIQSKEIASFKDILFSTKKDCQDLELQLKSAKMNIKEYESQNQYVHVITQQLNTTIEVLNKDNNKIRNELDLLKEQSQSREREKDKIISIFQYQLDDIQREKQQSLFCDPESGFQNVKSPTANSELYSGCTVPMGFQLIESSAIENFTSQINATNQKLKEQSHVIDLVTAEYNAREMKLLDQNSLLNDQYSTLNSEFQNHFKEIVILRKSIEDLQRELSKNSDTSIEEIRQELEMKSEALRIAVDDASQLESRLHTMEGTLSESLDGSKQENIKLANQLKSQGLLVENQTKKINELTILLQTYNHIQNESMFNGVTSDNYSEDTQQM